MKKDKKLPSPPLTSVSPSDGVNYEVRLVAIHGIPGTTEKEEGMVWRFGVTAWQAAELHITYPLY